MKPLNLKRILYMGCYDANYNRNASFIQGLRNYGIEVIEYNINSHNILENVTSFIKNFKKNLKNQYFNLILFHSQADFQFILAKILSKIKGIPLINDIYFSRLQTIYEDRKQFKKRKIPKFLLWIILYIIDLVECRFSDYIILDTYSHIMFFHDKFHVPIKKCRRILVGSQEDIFIPKKKERPNDNKFCVGFWGTYIPLHGINYIIKAAKILEIDKNINFILVGDGQTYRENKELAIKLKLQNIRFIRHTYIKELNKLADIIANFDVGLGIFGDSNKTLQVIPNKIYEGIAMKIPMITCESSAIKELFTNKKDIILCERGNPEALADSILKLKDDPNLRNIIKENAYVLYKEYCSINAIGRVLLIILNNIFQNKIKKK